MDILYKGIFWYDPTKKKLIAVSNAMLTLCDEILMFWDGSSKASRENLEDGLRIKKPTKAVLRPFEVREIKAENDLKLNHA